MRKDPQLDSKSVEYLLRRLRHCDKRWEAAMAHKEYRDEPTPDRPFTDAERVRMYWAEAWRVRFHEYEEALYRNREVRLGLIEGIQVRTPATIYER
jgi:hypothetical protein